LLLLLVVGSGSRPRSLCQPQREWFGLALDRDGFERFVVEL
jgi:hypothetical protein